MQWADSLGWQNSYSVKKNGVGFNNFHSEIASKLPNNYKETASNNTLNVNKSNVLQ